MSTIQKDAAFCIVLIAITTIMLHLWYTDGQWLCSAPKLLLLWGLLFYASFVRHNGFFFTVPIILFLPFLYKGAGKKMIMILFSISVVFSMAGYVFVRTVLIEKKVLYQDRKQQKFIESVGLPMCIMSDVYVHHTDKLSDEARAFMYSINPPDLYRQNYLDEFNSIKWNSNAFEVFAHISPEYFIKLFVSTCRRFPVVAWQTVLRITSITWWIDHPFTTPGCIILLLMVASVFAFLRKGWKIIFYAAPFIAYNFGTAVLLARGDIRFFCGIMVGAVPICVMFLSKERDFSDK